MWIAFFMLTWLFPFFLLTNHWYWILWNLKIRNLTSHWNTILWLLTYLDKHWNQNEMLSNDQILVTLHCKPFHCKNCRFSLCPFSHCNFTAVWAVIESMQWFTVVQSGSSYIFCSYKTAISTIWNLHSQQLKNCVFQQFHIHVLQPQKCNCNRLIMSISTNLYFFFWS